MNFGKFLLGLSRYLLKANKQSFVSINLANRVLLNGSLPKLALNIVNGYLLTAQVGIVSCDKHILMYSLINLDNQTTQSLNNVRELFGRRAPGDMRPKLTITQDENTK